MRAWQSSSRSTASPPPRVVPMPATAIEIEAWEYDLSCPLDEVVRLASERLATPSFLGRVLARRGDALTLHVASGAPSGAPGSRYYVRGEGPFLLERIEQRPAHGGAPERLFVTLRALERGAMA